MSATPSTSKDTKESTTESLALVAKIAKTEGVPNLNVVPQPELSLKTEALPVSTVKGEIKVSTDVDTKPETKPTPQIAVKDLIAQQLLRFSLKKISKPKSSTYVPIALNYFQVIRFMDELICDNTYFKNQVTMWHPLISRQYFGALMHYQTLRAASYAKILPLRIQVLVAELEKSLPPEKLPIPGPLVPMLKGLCASTPIDDTYGIVSPTLPLDKYPLNTSRLVPRNNEMKLSANVMFTNGLLQLITSADTEDEIPDLTIPGTLVQGQPLNILGHNFANIWTRDEKDAFLQPSSIFLPESSNDWDISVYEHAEEYDLEVFQPNEAIPDMLTYCGLADANWLDKLIPVMSTYSNFFKDSSNLGTCSPYGPPTALVRSRLTKLTSNTAADNIVQTIDEAFPDIYPFKLIYDHRSYEVSIPQIHQMMAQYGAFNTMIDYRGMSTWSRINVANEMRNGPYWSQDPSYLICHHDNGMNSIENIIKEYYFNEIPKE